MANILLPKIPEALIKKIQAFQKQIIDNINKKFSELSDIEHFIGSDNLTALKDNHDNHMDFMISLWRGGDNNTLEETVGWVLKSYTNHGFKKDYWYLSLNYWLESYKLYLTEDEVYLIKQYYFYMLIMVVDYHCA